MVTINNNQTAIERINWTKVFPELLLFLILPSIIGLPLIIYRIWNGRNTTKTQYFVFFFCIATYFAAINATKMPDGDQVQYYYAYKNVPEQGFIGSLINIYGITYSWQEERTQISGEFMNGVYNYVGYYLTFGYYPLFAAMLTFVDYILIFLGLYKFCQTLKKPHIPIVCGVLTLSFFYLFFNYTLHIQKQFLAQCIMMYVLGMYAVSGKMTVRLWIIAGCAVFTHASTALFVPFLAFKPLRGRLNKKGLFTMIGMMVAFVLLGPRFASDIVSDNSVVGYSAQRFAQAEGQKDLASVMVMSQVIVIALPMFFIVFRQLWMRRQQRINDSQAFILNIVLLLLVSITVMFNMPLAQYRYFMMLFAFMPFVYPFIFSSIKVRDDLLKMLSFIMIGWFYFQFEKIIWNYVPEWQIMVYPPAVLIGIGF